MQALLKALSWTFLHSFWQGLIAALLAAIVISSTRRSTAKLRYNLLGAILLVFLGVAVVTFTEMLNQQLEQAATGISAPLVDGTFSPASASTADGGFAAGLRVWFDNNAGVLMLAWMLFFLLNCLKLTTGLATVRRLRHYKTSPVGDDWNLTLERLRINMKISLPVQLLYSALVKVPVVLGVFRPVILVPVGLLANIPAEQAEAILLHELAHVRRKDYFVNLLQRFADAIFFFNPAFTWISSLLRQEREACCDDLAVIHTGQKRNYVDALVSFQEYSLINTTPAMAIGTKRHYLLNRVKRILTNENKRLNLFERLSLLAGLILFAAFSSINEPQKEERPAAGIVQGITIDPAPLGSPGMLAPREPITVKKERKRPVLTSTATLDTVPLKKDTQALNRIDKEKLPTKKEWDEDAAKAKKALNEIGQIKEKIGKKKDEIGISKEKLKTLQKSQETEIKKEQSLIDQRRTEIEKDRSELEIKRAEFQKYKKAEDDRKQLLDKMKQANLENEKERMKEALKEKQKEQQNEQQKEMQKDKIKTKEAENEKKQQQQNNPKPRISSQRSLLFKKDDVRVKLFDNKKSLLAKPKKISVPPAATLKTEPIKISPKIELKNDGLRYELTVKNNQSTSFQGKKETPPGQPAVKAPKQSPPPAAKKEKQGYSPQ